MAYDFENYVNRLQQGSFKWQEIKEIEEGVEIIPFSVADTDFLYPPQFIKGMQEYISSMIFGYTGPTADYYSAVISWMQRRHHFQVHQEEIVLSPGVVTALSNSIRTFSKAGEGVIIMTPVYHPFKQSIEDSGRLVVENKLLLKDDHYMINFTELEHLAAEDNHKILLLCNPHNPIGRVFTRSELERINDICLKHNVLVISDEIHMDLMMSGHTHTVFSTLNEAAKMNSIICTSPSKSFNLAGFQLSNIIIANPSLREKYLNYVEKNSMTILNAMSYKACELAYNECEDWFDELLSVVEYNHQLIKEFVAENHLPITVYPLEGTYLQWLDFSELKVSDSKLHQFLKYECHVVMSEGVSFGEAGKGHMRMNIAVPTRLMKDTLERIKSAYEDKGELL